MKTLNPSMPTIIEKREFRIPPCKIDKELVGQVGEILESDPICKNQKMVYSLESRFRKIESESVKDFVTPDWPNDTHQISVSTGTAYPRLVEIMVSSRASDLSKVTVSNPDATWANGMSKTLEDIFARKKLGYSFFLEDLGMKFLIVLATWASLSLALTFLVGKVNANATPPRDFWQDFSLIFLLGGLTTGWLVYLLLDWLYPRYEFGETIQKRLRKWIWSVLCGSGILATILDKIVFR
jgi:hypothetical protein